MLGESLEYLLPVQCNPDGPFCFVSQCNSNRFQFGVEFGTVPTSNIYNDDLYPGEG